MKRKGVRGWFRLPVADRGLAESDVDVELESHLEERVERLMAQGMTAEDARREAERRLGGAPARYALLREAWDRDARLSLRERLRSWLDDLRYAARGLGRQRGYTAVVVVTLALGIGANATMFGLLDRLLLSGPDHVTEPAALYRFYATTRPSHTPDPQTFSRMNGPLLMSFRESVASLEHISGYMEESLTLGAGATARRLELSAVSASFFELTGVQPVLGRFFDESEDAPPGGEQVIVVSHGLWQSELGGRSDAIGESLMLSGRPYTIIGVAPRGFTGVELAPKDGWVPLASTAALAMGPQWATEWMGFYMNIVGRLRDGATGERAGAEATAAWRAAVPEGWTGTRDAEVTIAGIGADQSGAEPMEARVARWLMAVALIVLLVACANVANLYFARGLMRRREIAVRLALGVSRARLIRLFLVESILLAMLGGAAALAVAWWGAEIVRTVLVPHIDWTTSPLNARVLGIAAALTALVGLFTGLAPAVMSSATRLAPSLAGSASVPPAPGRARSALTVLQAAFCVVLLVGAGVFIRSLWGVLHMDLGMETERVVAMQVEWETPDGLTPEARAQLSARRRTILAEAAARVAAQPGVELASVGIGAAFAGAFGASIRVEGLDSIPQLPGGGPYVSAVGPDYFGVLGTPVLRGRTFRHGEGAGTDPVVIVSRTTAERLWPGTDPIDRCVYMDGASGTPCSRVVGVVADMRRFRITEDAAMQLYVPFGQQPAWMGGIRILARTSVRPSTLADPLRRTLHSMDPTFRYVNIQPFSEYLEPQRRPWKLGAVLFALCGLLALSIAVIGLYSVIAYLVAHRRHEIGVRIALGAERRDVIGLVLRQALLLAGLGVVIGITAAALAAPFLQPLLFETDARDAAVFGAAAGVLLIAALAAGVVPAWRASRVPPTEALRSAG